MTGKENLVITDCQTQKDIKCLAGSRSVCLDAYGTDSTGKKYDLEIQRADQGAAPHRARYYSSVLDVENLDAGQDFDELPDTYVIFIAERDIYGQGMPIYSFERTCCETGQLFGDGEHILYVNGEYRGDSEVGRLMHDFNCVNADDMTFELMAERTRHLKGSREGVNEVSRIVEEIVGERVKESMVKTALRMLRAGGYALEEVARISGLPLDEVKQLKTSKNT